jgi:hypothetical protein
MSGNRFEPETVVVAKPADRGPRQATEQDVGSERHAVREEDDDQSGDEIDEPGYGHGV